MPLVRGLVIAAVATALVKSLKASRYTFRISDRSRSHNFVLEQSHGGELERRITSVPFVGTQRISIRLTRGEWEFYCAPHASMMHGDFTVT
jgi:plastocyanin